MRLLAAWPLCLPLEGEVAFAKQMAEGGTSRQPKLQRYPPQSAYGSQLPLMGSHCMGGHAGPPLRATFPLRGRLWAVGDAGPYTVK